MKQIAKIGNLIIYREDNPLADARFEDGPTMTLHAVNGTDDVMHETFYAADEAVALDRFMHLFDYYTLSDIRAGVPEIVSEYDGALLSGKIAGFDAVEYFKRVDATRFYKRFTHRPAMTAEEFQAMHG